MHSKKCLKNCGYTTTKKQKDLEKGRNGKNKTM